MITLLDQIIKLTVQPYVCLFATLGNTLTQLIPLATTINAFLAQSIVSVVSTLPTALHAS
jgi:hypothetical protein